MKLILRLAYCWFLLTLSLPAVAVPVQGHRMMLAGPNQSAVMALREVSATGGNVVDAAVAVALALAVTSPYNSSLGGGGFAMVKMGPKVEVLDFRETAPAATHPKYYHDKPATASTHGGAAVGTPGIPAGLWALHKKYGQLPWKKLFTTALLLAQEGFHLSGEWVDYTNEEKTHFNEAGRKFFFKTEGKSYKPGESLRQVALAQALLELRNKGLHGFYHGAVASDIVKSIANQKGHLSLDDLKNYQVRWLEPLTHDYRGHRFYFMPPPSSGGVVLKTIFSLVEKTNLEKYKPLSFDELHVLAEILSRSFRGRALLGDPDFHKNPLEQILSVASINSLASSIRTEKATSIPPLAPTPTAESQETTHFSIMDASGKAVAMTITLNGNYGSRVVSERFGIALNNEMDDFTTHPGQPNQFGLIQGAGNNIAAGKRPLSSMSPTLVEKDGKIIISLGAPGGPRIISGVFQALYRHLVSDFDLDRAVQSPRLHHQYMPNKLWLDKNRFAPESAQKLTQKGHHLEYGEIARVYAVRLRPDGILEAAYDSRGEGAAGGY